MPFKRVRLTTLVTPGHREPGDRSSAPLVLGGGDDLARRRRAHSRSTASARTSAGNDVDFTIPMMFVSRAATRDAARSEVIDAYNDSSDARPRWPTRSATVPGQKMLFAERDVAAARHDNTLLVTRTLNFALRRRQAPAAAEGRGQRPAGAAAAGHRRADDDPALSGLRRLADSTRARGVFAEVVKETPAAATRSPPWRPTTLGVKFSSDQAGGFATPNLGVSSADAAAGPARRQGRRRRRRHVRPGTFFPAGTAAALRHLRSRRSARGATAGRRTRRSSDAIAGHPGRQGSPDRDPRLGARRSQNLPPSRHRRVHADRQHHSSPCTATSRSRMTSMRWARPYGRRVAVHGRRSTTSGQRARVGDGQLHDVRFRRRKSGAKPDVTVQLDPAPPRAFTATSSSSTSSATRSRRTSSATVRASTYRRTGVRAGFSFALPPLAVGVFALQDVALGAALTLPFVDGRPSSTSTSRRARTRSCSRSASSAAAASSTCRSTPPASRARGGARVRRDRFARHRRR